MDVSRNQACGSNFQARPIESKLLSNTFPVLLLIIFYKLTFECVQTILNCDRSNTILLCRLLNVTVSTY